MNGFQASMLLTAAAFSLVSMIVVYLVALFALTLFLKPKPSILRLAIGFAISWAAVSVYLPFKNVSYYTQNSGEMYLAELIISIVALFAVTKLSPTGAATPSYWILRREASVKEQAANTGGAHTTEPPSTKSQAFSDTEMRTMSSTPPTAMPISMPQHGTTATVNLDDEFWARALAEYESKLRRPGLYARVFSQAQGNEAVAKASYLKHRVEELSLEHQQRVRAQEQAEREAIEKARLSRLTAEQRAYELLPKGNCPSCETVIPLSASECPKCRALFGPGSALTVLPLKDV